MKNKITYFKVVVRIKGVNINPLEQPITHNGDHKIERLTIIFFFVEVNALQTWFLFSN